MALTTASVITLRDMTYIRYNDFATSKALLAERERAAEVALQYGGESALNKIIVMWPEEFRDRLHFADSDETTKDIYIQPLPSNIIKRHILPLSLFLLAWLVFSIALSWYLSYPISLLRNGFRKLSLGKLDTRIGSRLGARKDEISDLAREFDIMADRLHNLIASRDRLLHDVSHELKSPLGRLRLAVSLAKKNGQLDDSTTKRIQREITFLNNLTSDLLSLSRAEANKAGEGVYFDIAVLLKTICNDTLIEAEHFNVNIDLELGSGLEDEIDRSLFAYGSPELVRRAIENVIRNGIRFSPPGKTVFVSARIKEKTALIDIRDEGPGASADFIESMFDPFVKGPEGYGEVGLGLSIARRALAVHNGGIHVVEHEGSGLLMRLTVPLYLDTELL